ncbi:hypothetical protein E8E11_010730 [Didymella keratinophila]|nr:hypothetical protein E8E11_010730 [Didymella keratinophila]
MIAGAIGGVIGRAIVNKPQDHGTPTTNCPNPTVSPDPLPTNTSSIDPSARILPISKTGCSSTTSQQYVPSTSINSRIQYTMVCATRWTNPHLVAISAATTSDCIEACSSYNDNAMPDRTCLGASFVPQWWNQTRAMGDKNAPFNCFLMGANDKIEQNRLGFEIVALYLGEACKDKIGF